MFLIGFLKVRACVTVTKDNTCIKQKMGTFIKHWNNHLNDRILAWRRTRNTHWMGTDDVDTHVLTEVHKRITLTIWIC